VGRDEDIVRDTSGFRLHARLAKHRPSTEKNLIVNAQQFGHAPTLPLGAASPYRRSTSFCSQIAAATISAVNPTSANHALRMAGDLSQHVLELRELFKLIGGNVFG
jgi:hypothetical protein